MVGEWPTKTVIDAVLTIMGDKKGPGEMPRQRIPKCRDTLGAAIVDRLNLVEVAPRKLDALVERVLRAVVDAASETPDMMSARELLGFTLRTPEDIAGLVQDPTSGLSDSEKENGYRSKVVRLYLAGLHHDPPLAVRTARDKQESDWAPAIADALDDFLDDPETLDEARAIAASLGLQFTSESVLEVAPRELAEPASTETDDVEPSGWPWLDPYDGLLSLSSELEQALNAARNACRLNHRDFYTSDVLLVLFALPGDRTASCFEHAGDGVSSLVRQKLLEIRGFQELKESPLEIRERPDVECAFRYAYEDTMRVVNDLHLLCAILDGSSETNLGLKQLLGDRHAVVRERAGSWRQHQPPTTRTPRMQV